MNTKLHTRTCLLSALLVACFYTLACGRAPEAAARQKPMPAVRSLTLAPQVFEQVLELTGSVEAATIATLSSPAEGPVMELSVREGDRVEAGQMLLRIGRTSGTDAELAAAEEAWQTQKKEYERIRRLVEERAVAGEQLDMARAALERSSSQRSLAQQAARDFRIEAPWGGIVSRLHVAEGRYTAPRLPLLELFDPGSLLLRFQVPERHAFQLALGQSLTARFDAFSGQAIPLEISRAWPELDRRLRSRTFEAALPLDQYPFAPGQFVRISLLLERVEAAITIPATALVTLPKGQPGVYVIDSEDKAQGRPVQIGGESQGQLWITQGLSAGDALVVEGQQNLKPGQMVRQAKGKGAQ